jgi:nitrile hydratase
VLASETIDGSPTCTRSRSGRATGASVVARAWVNKKFKQRLLAGATRACAELEIGGMQGEHMAVVENTDAIRNVIVCTLCWCYPWPVLGLPPNWYKCPSFRSRIARTLDGCCVRSSGSNRRDVGAAAG